MAENVSVPDVRYERVLGDAQAALDKLRRLSIPPTPRVFELLYESAIGTKPGLKERIELEFRKSDLRLSDVERICDDYLGKQKTADDAVESANRLDGSIEEVRVAMANSSLAVADFAQILASSSDIFSGEMDAQSLRKITKHLLSETRRAQLANQLLEGALEASRSAVGALKADLEEVREAAAIDALTGVHNRRYLDQELARAVSYSIKSRRPLALMMVDIDHFKKVNDNWGHQTGDLVLRHVATILKTKLRDFDITARYGGEEFVALLPDTDLRGGIVAANKVREFLAAGAFVKRSTAEKIGQVTASFGVAVCHPGDVPATLIERVDRCLYMAKSAGRNCVVGEDELFPTDRHGNE
jgi:diguanylate cyclase